MSIENWVRYFFLDASAIVKLVVKEDGSNNLRGFFNSSELFRTTSVTLSEAYGVIKRKWIHRGRPDKITNKGYFNAMYLLSSYVRNGRIKLTEASFLDANDFIMAEELVKKYPDPKRADEFLIDMVDALQIVSMKKETEMTKESAPVLVTTDNFFEIIATKEGLKVWNCNKKERPPE